MIALLVVLILGAVLVFWAIGIYNGLVKSRNNFKNAFSQIDVQLKRRYDLIPNLVETAKGYLSHERQTLEAVIAARNSAYTASQKAGQNPDDANAIRNLAAAEGNLGGALSRLMVVSEAYPELKSNTTMNNLMEELSSTENKVSFSRQAFNDAVTEYNNKREVFPNTIFAGMFGFQPAQLFEVTEAAHRENVQVKF